MKIANTKENPLYTYFSTASNFALVVCWQTVSQKVNHLLCLSQWVEVVCQPTLVSQQTSHIADSQVLEWLEAVNLKKKVLKYLKYCLKI